MSDAERRSLHETGVTTTPGSIGLENVNGSSI